MRWRLASIAYAVLLAAATPAPADDLDDVMHALAARRHGAASFTEQKFLSMLKQPIQSSGELVYDAPDRLEKRTLEPRPESLVLDGNVLTVTQGRRSRVLELKSYPQIQPLIEGIRATLAGDRDALEKLFRLQFSGALAGWSLGLVPRDANTVKTIAEIRIAGAQDNLLTVEIREADGDRSLMTLSAPVKQ